MKKISQIKMGAILSYIQMFAQCIISLSYTPMMIAVLGDSEYGVYSLATSIVSYLSILNLGFSSVYIRFYSKLKIYNDEKKVEILNGMFLTIFIILSVIAMIIGYWVKKKFHFFFSNTLSAEQIALGETLLGYMVFNLALSFIDSVFTSFVTSHENFIFQKILNMLKTVLLPIVIIIMLKMEFHSKELVIITTIFTVIGFIFNVLFCVYKLNIKFKFGEFDFTLLKEMAIFSLYIAVSSLIDQINWNVDKIILGKMHGAKEVAIYSTASQINTLVMQFSTSISNVFVTRINKLVAQGKSNEISNLFIKIGRIQFLVLSLVVSGYIFFGKYFITDIFANHSYVNAYYIGILLIVPVVIPLIQNVGIEIQRSLNKHKFRTYSYLIMAVINIVISIFLGKQYSGLGVAIGTAASIIIANGIGMNIYYYRVIKLDILAFWKNICSFIPALVLPTVVGGIIKYRVIYFNHLHFVIMILIYIFVFSCSVWKYGLNDYEKNMIRKLKRG